MHSVQRDHLVGSRNIFPFVDIDLARNIAVDLPKKKKEKLKLPTSHPHPESNKYFPAERCQLQGQVGMAPQMVFIKCVAITIQENPLKVNLKDSFLY